MVTALTLETDLGRYGIASTACVYPFALETELGKYQIASGVSVLPLGVELNKLMYNLPPVSVTSLALSLEGLPISTPIWDRVTALQSEKFPEGPIELTFHWLFEGDPDAESLDYFDLWKIPGAFPHPDGSSFNTIESDDNSIFVSRSFRDDREYIEIVSPPHEFRSWTYYLFSVSHPGGEGDPTYSGSAAVHVEFFPRALRRPRVSRLERGMLLRWDPVKTGYGVNVFRIDGAVSDFGNAIKLNTYPLTRGVFEDGPGNTINRVTVEELGYPVSWGFYQYVIEVVKLESMWDEGNRNQSRGVEARRIASKDFEE